MIFSEPVLDFIESAFVFGNSAKDIADHILADRYSKAVHSQNVICQLKSRSLLAVVEGMESDEVQCLGGLPEAIGPRSWRELVQVDTARRSYKVIGL